MPDTLLAWFDPHHLTGALILAVLLSMAAMILCKLLRRLLRGRFLHSKAERLDHITLSFLSRLMMVFIWLCMVILYAYLVPDLHKVGTAMLAGVGIVSIIGGFASQSTLGHLAAGISMVFLAAIPLRRPPASECANERYV